MAAANSAAFTKVGTHTVINQDTAFARHEILAGTARVAVAAVFDGHGLLGEVASQVAAEALPASVASETSWTDQPEDAMRRVMSALQKAVIDAHDPGTLPKTYVHQAGEKSTTYTLSADGRAYVCSTSSAQGMAAGRSAPVDFGCTAAVAVLVLQTRTLVIGNVGDSAVLLCSASQTGDELSVSPMSVTHAASEPAEMRRLAITCAAGGHARLIDGYLQAIRGQLRGHSLQPTRGLGHPVWASYGISCEPHVASVVVSDSVDGVSDRFAFAVVVLSDGITDVLDETAILDAVAQAESAEVAACTLVEDAASLADVTTGGSDRDDASAAIIWWG